MSKLLKILGALLLLPIVAAVLVAVLFDPNDFKEDVEEGFLAATGHELVVGGHLRVSLLPSPVLEITEVSVPGAGGPDRPALAELDRVRFYPRLLPLLDGRLELRLVRLEGLQLQLILDEQGRGNWKRAEGSPAAGSSAPGTRWRPLGWPVERPGPLDVLAADVSAGAQGLAIGRVEALDARVTWDDRRFQHKLQIDGLEIFAGPVIPEEPIILRVSGSLNNGNTDTFAPLQAEARLRVNTGSGRAWLEQMELAIKGLELQKGLRADLKLRAGLDVDLDARRYQTDDLVLKVEGSGETLSGGRIRAEVGARLELDLRSERLQVSDLSIRSGALSARGAALGRNLLSAPVFTGDLAVDELDLRAWLGQGGVSLPATADAETLRRCSLNTRWRLVGDRLAVHDLALNVDQTALTGEIERIATRPRGYQFDLKADRLNLDRYLPASGAVAAGSKTKLPQSALADNPPASGAPQADQPSSSLAVETQVSVSAPVLPKIPFAPELIGYWDLDGRVRIGDLQLSGLRFGDADIRIKAKDEILEVGNHVERFYEGRLTGRFGLDLRGAQPSIDLTQRAEGIQTGSLLADLAWGDRLSGRGTASADLTASGYSTDALRRSLAGNLTMDIPQGVLRGFSLERLVREAESRARGKNPPADLPTQTDFKDLHASAEVQGGVLHNKDLAATTDHLRIAGAGSADLTEERFDYRFEPVFVKPPQGRGIKELEGISIPVRLTGPFSRPRWEVDLGSALRAAAERQLGEQGGDLLQELEERTGINGLKKGLKGLLGQ